jgi:hypothetical protein
MWELSIAIRGGRSLQEKGGLMSSDFDQRIKGLKDAYAHQQEARRTFTAAWSRVSARTIKPVLEIAERNFRVPDSYTSLEITDDDSKLSLVIKTIPVGKQKVLSFCPNWREESVDVVADGNKRNEQRIPLEEISADLIESQVENFLKNALRLEG